ncbi:MAG TPA: metal ABC transporter permease, partial [Pirellulales bacterium]|nr:metal ABC transporter permease [Pirellulales bacterium]
MKRAEPAPREPGPHGSRRWLVAAAAPLLAGAALLSAALLPAALLPAALRRNYNTIIVLAGTSLLGAGAGLVGAYAVLRRRALLGDALAHAGLPGICLGFLVWGER